MTIDITIPVLNEEATLATQILKLRQYLQDHFRLSPQGVQGTANWQIVIADNGSTDQTGKIGKKLAQEYSDIQFVQVPEKGVGLALKTSWGQSCADIVGYMDLDLATDLRHFQPAIEAITEQNYDLVYATRLHRDSKVIGRTAKREFTSRVFNSLLKIYLGIKFSDGMCGFKFLKRSKLQPLMEHGADNDGWFFSTELLTIGEWLDYKIFELPVIWTDDVSSSRVKVIPLAKKYLKSMHQLKGKKKQISSHA